MFCQTKNKLLYEIYYFEITNIIKKCLIINNRKLDKSIKF